jgi:methylated-DNA-[protein]-cysteine S-methyltransferase
MIAISYEQETRGASVGLLLLDTPIGKISVEGDEEVLTGVGLPSMRPDLAARAERPGRPPRAAAEAARQLDEYFQGARQEFELEVVLQGTPFQRDVWTELAEIPFGETVSYAELAQMVGRPRAFRAVGQANGANPLAIVLPCHRVLASGGGIGGYGGGIETKRRLLALEGRADERASAVVLAPEDVGRERVDSVQEEDAVEMVDLV